MEEIKIACRAANILPIDSIIEFQGKLKKSILKNGFTAPIFIWEDAGDNKILDGHQRLATLIKMRQEGYDIPLLPVAYIYAEDETEARRKLLAITSQYGEFDALELADWLDELDDDIKDTLRFVDEEMIIESDKNIETAGDDEIPDNIVAITKLGDLWELGAHRVLCGDSTDAETVALLMDGQKADMVFTDPPYGMGLDVSNSDILGGKGKWKNKAKNYTPVIGDDKDYNPTHLFKIFVDVKEMFLWGFDYFAEFIPNRKTGSVIVWDKRKGVENMKLTFSEFELCWSRAKHLREIVRITWSGLLGTEQEFDHKRHHPTQKPIELSVWFIDKYGKDGWVIADLFLGSGSTLIACEKINRICYGMELDPHYCDVIVYRYRDWCEANDRTPIIKLNGEDYEL